MVQTIAQMMCLRFAGGIRAVAASMRTHDGRPMTEGVLQKKLSPTVPTHHLSANEAFAISVITGFPDLALEFCSAVGMIAIPAPPEGDEDSSELIGSFADAGREFADLVHEFNRAIADNKISPNECDAYRNKLVELYSAGMRCLSVMYQKAETRGPVIGG